MYININIYKSTALNYSISTKMIFLIILNIYLLYMYLTKRYAIAESRTVLEQSLLITSRQI